MFYNTVLYIIYESFYEAVHIVYSVFCSDISNNLDDFSCTFYSIFYKSYIPYDTIWGICCCLSC